MPHDPASAERRAYLIREMARDRAVIEPQGTSDASSDRADAQGFGTESQMLPPLPRTTNKNSHEEWKINTSALRRAFPNFSQYGSSDEESIEIGRGVKRGADRTSKSILSEDPSASMSLTFPQTGERWKVTDTPPLKARRQQAAEQGDLRRQSHNAKSSQDGEGKQAYKTAVETQSSVDAEPLAIRPPPINVAVRESRWGSRQKQPLNSATLLTPNKSALQSAMQNMGSAQAGTMQSFVLPDIPNITELVSGVRGDGTPLFSRSARPKSRFTNKNKTQNAKPSHMGLGGVPIPTDEKALYASLQLLQEKVAALESDKDKLEKRSEDYELEVLQLRSKLEEVEGNRHSDSGVGFDEEETKTKEWEQERSQFAINMKTLEMRLDRANKKLATSEMTIKDLEQDRDTAHAQLMQAHLGSEELKTESRAVSDEIIKAKRHVDKINRQWEKRLQKLIDQEEELRAKITRREKAINEMSALVRDLWNVRKAIAAQEARGRQPSGPARPASRRQSSRPRSVTANDAEGDASDVESTTNFLTDKLNNKAQYSQQEDADYVSFMQGDELPKLRQVVEEDRAQLAQPFDSAQASAAKASLPRKSSLKRSRHNSQSENNTHDFSVQFSQHSNRTSVHSRQSNREATDGHDMTSEIILPDITLTGFASGTTSKRRVSIPRPVPVSDRQLEDESDHTIRPAQDPAVALAMVLKALEDEITILRSQLSQQEALYHGHDPALSKRKRKAVFGRILRLLNAIELKSDQVYALYDVLEGQKAQEQLMDESQIEVTLRDIGIDADQVLGKKSATDRRQPQVELEDGSDDEELPWEGFDTSHSLASLRV